MCRAGVSGAAGSCEKVLRVEKRKGPVRKVGTHPAHWVRPRFSLNAPVDFFLPLVLRIQSSGRRTSYVLSGHLSCAARTFDIFSGRLAIAHVPLFLLASLALFSSSPLHFVGASHAYRPSPSSRGTKVLLCVTYRQTSGTPAFQELLTILVLSLCHPFSSALPCFNNPSNLQSTDALSNLQSCGLDAPRVAPFVDPSSTKLQPDVFSQRSTLKEASNCLSSAQTAANVLLQTRTTRFLSRPSLDRQHQRHSLSAPSWTAPKRQPGPRDLRPFQSSLKLPRARLSPLPP